MTDAIAILPRPFPMPDGSSIQYVVGNTDESRVFDQSTQQTLFQTIAHGVAFTTPDSDNYMVRKLETDAGEFEASVAGYKQNYPTLFIDTRTP